MDRFTSLPQEVLCHILSFLTTKEAALTSVLSKRWRNLLAFVPCLDLDCSGCLFSGNAVHDWDEVTQRSQSFMDFVDRILALQGNSPIVKLSLKYPLMDEASYARVDGWISNVLVRGVSDLDLCLSPGMDYEYEYRLCPKCFKSSALTKLKISGVADIGWKAGRIFLPMLKTLILDSVGFVGNFEILLRACPVLEELFLSDIIWKDVDVTVSSATLKKLTINSDYDVCLTTLSFDTPSQTLSFDTPSLVYFEYHGYFASDYPVVNMPNVFDAWISLSLLEEHLKRVRTPDHDWVQNDTDVVARKFRNLRKLFHGIRHVPELYLSSDTLEMLSPCCESMLVFNNLKSLHIESAEDRGWQAMPILLRKCPHLETLVIEGLVHHVTDKCGDACDCISREDKGHSLSSCPIKMLEIQEFRGTMKEMQMIKHFLDYFPCLEEMSIFIKENDPEVPEHIVEMLEQYNELSSCNIKLSR